MSAIQSLRDRAREQAVGALKDHAVTPEGDGRWRCGRPRSSTYCFRVITSPGAVFVHGDVGELVLLHRDRDSLEWLRSTLAQQPHEVDYVLSKIPTDFRQQVFDKALAEEVLAEEASRGTDVSSVREAIADADRHEIERAWDEAWLEIQEDGEFPSANYWDHATLFKLECLRWFASRIPAPVTAPGAPS